MADISYALTSYEAEDGVVASAGPSVGSGHNQAARQWEDLVDTCLLAVGFFSALVVLRILTKNVSQMPPHSSLKGAGWHRTETVQRVLRAVVISYVLITAVVLILSTLEP